MTEDSELLCYSDYSGNQGQEETVLGGAVMKELWGFQFDVRNHGQHVEICRADVKWSVRIIVNKYLHMVMMH